MFYIRVWMRLAQISTAQFLSNRIDSATYFFGKLIRFGFFMLLIFALYRHTDNIAGYGPYELLLFFLIFYVLDVLAQIFFRGLYIFKGMINRGTFDFMLTKPINTLFYVMSRLIDPLDLLFLIPIIAILIWNISVLSITIPWSHYLLFCFFVFVAFLILTALHIFFAVCIILFVDADNMIWSYRYMMTLGRFPPEIFSTSFALVFTIIIPIFVVTAFPTKALLGLLTPFWAVLGTCIAILFFACSLVAWNITVKKYSSASS